MFENIKKLFKEEKEERFLTTANGGIEFSKEVLDAYGNLDIIYDRKIGILYCGIHKPYLFWNKNIKQILFDELFRTKDDTANTVYTINFDQDKYNFLKSTDIFEAMGIKMRGRA